MWTEELTHLQGQAGRNPSGAEEKSPEANDLAKFDPTRKNGTSLATLTHGKHQCIGIDPSTAFVEGLIKLVAKLKNLRPAPGEMGVVKTITVGSEKAYLNDSWSYLGPYASSKSSSLP